MNEYEKLIMDAKNKVERRKKKRTWINRVIWFFKGGK